MSSSKGKGIAGATKGPKRISRIERIRRTCPPFAQVSTVGSFRHRGGKMADEHDTVAVGADAGGERVVSIELRTDTIGIGDCGNCWPFFCLEEDEADGAGERRDVQEGTGIDMGMGMRGRDDEANVAN